MEVFQEGAVLGPSEDGVGVEGFLDGQAFVVVEGLGAGFGGGGQAVIPALGADVEGLVGQAGFLQHGVEGDAGPFAGAEDHAFGSAGGAGAFALEILEKGGVGAGAFHYGADGAAGETAEVIER